MEATSSAITNVLESLLTKAGISEAELGRKTNIPRATINRITSGKTPNPRPAVLKDIADYFGVTIDQLLGNAPLEPTKSNVDITRFTVPVLGWEDIRNWQQTVNSFDFSMSNSWLLADEPNNNSLFAVQVIGDSMWPVFQENTTLIIDPNKQPKNRDYVVAYINEQQQSVCRQLLLEGNYKLLKPINEAFPTIKIKEKDEIIGVVTQTRNVFA